MKAYVVVLSLILLVPSQLAYSRTIKDVLNLPSVGGEYSGSSRSFVEATTVTCEPPYGILPCSDNVWGQLFLIVVYGTLLSIGGQYVSDGSDLFFQIIGPGVVGGSVFQFLGTIVQLIIMLVPLLAGSEADAQARVTSGLGMVLGRVAINLTLVWGLSVILGSYDLSEEDDSISKETTLEGTGIVTDVETSWTARLILIGSIPLGILMCQIFFSSETWKRVVILMALLVSVALLFCYILYQSFQPWIQNRCFEHMIDKYAKDKLVKLLALNGKPSNRKIQELFNKIDKDNNGSVTAQEVRVLILGVHVEDDEISAALDLDSIMAYFDLSGDGSITQDEFIKGMTGLASNLLDQTSTQSPSKSSQVNSEEQQALLARSPTTTTTTTSISWSIYFRATFYVLLGIAIACTLAQPLVNSITIIAEAANVSNFLMSYLVLPLALSYNTLLRSISSALQKAPQTTSLSLSSLYGGVFMNNMMGLIPYLAPLYFRNLSSDVSAEVFLLLLLCVVMGFFTGFNTTFPRWSGYVVLSMYPVSLLAVYLLTSVLGWD